MRGIISCTLAGNTWQINKSTKQATKEPTNQTHFYRDEDGGLALKKVYFVS
jgi:hypothetical protein